MEPVLSSGNNSHTRKPIENVGIDNVNDRDTEKAVIAQEPLLNALRTPKKKKTFGTRGPVTPEKHYVVPRTAELADFLGRVREGRYLVIFAPRQTGKTTFFRRALQVLAADAPNYFPIELNFEEYVDILPDAFYESVHEDILTQIEKVFRNRGKAPPEALSQLFAQQEGKITNNLSLRKFFEEFAHLLNHPRIVLIIDEFDNIPQAAVRGFLHTLRRIYHEEDEKFRCLHSVGIVGVKNITQLNYDRAVSPFNIQDEFHLPNFTFKQVHELLGQYTAEVGQVFEPEVVAGLRRQTAGQPFLVNRLARMLTEEMNIPETETITLAHWTKAHAQILREQNVNIQHLRANIRRNPRFQTILMQIASYDEGCAFNLDDDVISELATYGVITEGEDGRCEIANPIYLYRILQTFKPTVNGLEREYFPEESGTAAGELALTPLLDNFRDFIGRAGFRILQVPETPKEYVGQHLLFAYLEQVVLQAQAVMHLEVQTGRGRIDLLINHRQRKYIVETKIWQGEKSYRNGMQQLAAYLKLEQATEGYYVVFDHRKNPHPRIDTETVDGVTIRSYVIPVMQEPPSAAS